MKRVLVVDDVPDNRYLLRVLLQGHGYTVDEAPNGAVALERARAHAPALIISDLLMPEMDGYTLLREWKADATLKAIPFVVYTATYTEPADAQLAFDLGADAFILKPAEPSEFMTELGAVIARAQSGRLSATTAPKLADLSLLTRHNNALIRKLARKATELERANRALQLDVIQRQRAEARAKELLRELQHKSTQLEQALSMARMGVWLWRLEDDAFTVLEGRGPLMALPWSVRPTTGQALMALVHPDDRASVEATIARAKLGDDCNAQFRMNQPSQDARWVSMQGRCLRDDAAMPVMITGLDQDVTDQKQLEERVRRVQKMEAIGQLAGGVAHDFNNILAAIIGNAELVQADVTCAVAVRACVSEILNAARRGTDLTQRILTFGRPHVDRLEPTSLPRVLEEAVQLLRATLPAGIELTLAMGEVVPPVLADASQIHQVMLNLIANARHAMPNEAGQIEARLESCRVDSTLCRAHPELHPGAYVRLTVRDTGSGMDAATLEHMFEPFYTTRSAGDGAGLGLSVVHGIVRAHQGAIFADSNPGQGTTFYIFLPACAEGTEVSDPPKKPARSVQGHGQHLLYVDDEPALVHVAVRFLQHCGFAVDGFTRAEEALQAFRGAAHRYQAVILDYNMPGMSGIDLAQQLLLIQPTMPIVLTTGYMRPEEFEKAHALGIFEVIPKPYLIEELGPRLQRVLSTPAAP